MFLADALQSELLPGIRARDALRPKSFGAESDYRILFDALREGIMPANSVSSTLIAMKSSANGIGSTALRFSRSVSEWSTMFTTMQSRWVMPTPITPEVKSRLSPSLH